MSLTWNAPQSCPSDDAVLAEVQRIVGGTTSHRMVARADVTEISPEHWSVHIATVVDGAQGERTLDANSCASLATATALILAWTVDPSKGHLLAAEQDAVVPPKETQRRAESLPAPRGPGASEPVAAVVAASGALDVGTLPSADAAAEITVGALLGPIRIEASGADWLTQEAVQALPFGGTPVGARIHVLDATLRGCFRGRFVPGLELDPCLGAGIVSATSDGFGGTPTTFRPAHNSGAWGAVEGDVLAAWRVFGPIALRVSIGGRIPLARPPFVVDLLPQGEVFLHKTAAFVGRATLGVEARFP